MRRSRIDEVGQSELVDIAEPLKGPRVKHATLIRIEADEHVDGVTDFVEVLWHDPCASLPQAPIVPRPPVARVTLSDVHVRAHHTIIAQMFSKGRWSACQPWPPAAG